MEENTEQIPDVGPKVFTSKYRVITNRIKVNYSDLLPNFDWVNSDFRTAQFRAIDCCKKTGFNRHQLKFEYAHLGRRANSAEVIAEMNSRGLRPALFKELVAFARFFPDEQKKFPIIALGSVCPDQNGNRVAGLFVDYDGKRILGLYSFEILWDDNFRFLATKNDNLLAPKSVGRPKSEKTVSAVSPAVPIDPDSLSAEVDYIQPDTDEREVDLFDFADEKFRGATLENVGPCKSISREKRVVHFKYFSNRRAAITKDLLAEMDKRGLRPAIYEELVAFSKRYPSEQRKYPIIALGSVFRRMGGYLNVPSLEEKKGYRYLCLCRGWDDCWNGNDCRFLAVPK